MGNASWWLCHPGGAAGACPISMTIIISSVHIFTLRSTRTKIIPLCVCRYPVPHVRGAKIVPLCVCRYPVPHVRGAKIVPLCVCRYPVPHVRSAKIVPLCVCRYPVPHVRSAKIVPLCVCRYPVPHVRSAVPAGRTVTHPRGWQYCAFPARDSPYPREAARAAS